MIIEINVNNIRNEEVTKQLNTRTESTVLTE